VSPWDSELPKFLGRLPLKPFGTPHERVFRARLDAATKRLINKLPQKARRWGRARKALNIFLRDCLYTVHTRRAYQLNQAEQFFELPLDSIIGARLAKGSGGALPRWKTVRALTPRASARYQSEALRVAKEEGFARVHLDAIWWGERKPGE
jgi:hypothetical protein